MPGGKARSPGDIQDCYVRQNAKSSIPTPRPIILADGIPLRQAAWRNALVDAAISTRRHRRAPQHQRRRLRLDQAFTDKLLAARKPLAKKCGKCPLTSEPRFHQGTVADIQNISSGQRRRPSPALYSVKRIHRDHAWIFLDIAGTAGTTTPSPGSPGPPRALRPSSLVMSS